MVHGYVHGYIWHVEGAFFLRGVLVSGTSLTNGLIQTDYDTKKVGAEKDEKKKCTTISYAVMYA